MFKNKTINSCSIGIVLLCLWLLLGDQRMISSGFAQREISFNTMDLKQDLLQIWNDPTFQKQFVAGYGINADIEPRLLPDEVAVLEKVRPLMADDLAAAESLLKKNLKPETSAIFDFTLGGIYFQQDQMKQALEHYQVAVKKFPSFRRAWRNLGLIYVKEGEYPKAIEAFTKMIELGGGDAYSYGLLGFAYAAKQDYQAAEAAYRNALLLQPNNVEWRLGLTRCVFRQQKYEDAVTLLEELITRYPEKSDFWLLQAQAYLGMKQPLKAAENLEAIDYLGKSTVDSLYTLGDIYLNENLLDLAARVYIRAADLNSQQPLSRLLQSAEIFSYKGALLQAQHIVSHLKEIKGKAIEATDQRRLLKLEARLSMSDGVGVKETAQILEEIIKLDPLDGEALILLGQYYSQREEADRAIFYFERAQNIEGFEVKAKLRHAQVLMTLGRYGEALPLLRRAQEVKPNDDMARYIEQVERLAKSRK